VRRQVQVEVSDTGPVLSAEDRARLFDPSAAPAGSGAHALGLSLCHRLVSGVGGSIRTRSAEGLPNVVEVRLPVAGGEEGRGS
jgi:signal transduction histidine kinase